jgi:hypothetical protein
MGFLIGEFVRAKTRRDSRWLAETEFAKSTTFGTD